MFFAIPWSPEGTFFSAEDADSPEGGKVLFISGQSGETEKVLGKEDARVAARVFTIKPEGNYQDTVNSPGAEKTPTGKTPLQKQHLLPAHMKLILKSGSKLHPGQTLTARQQRCPPLRDDKVLTDGNGLFIAALAQAARTFGTEGGTLQLR